MPNSKLLVPGSWGLIGPEVHVFFSERGFHVSGIESKHRAEIFGPDGDTNWRLNSLREKFPG